jgi:hypothetical protein
MGWGQTIAHFAAIRKEKVAGTIAVTTFTNVYEFTYNWNHIFYNTTIQLEVNEYSFYSPGNPFARI